MCCLHQCLVLVLPTQKTLHDVDEEHNQGGYGGLAGDIHSAERNRVQERYPAQNRLCTYRGATEASNKEVLNAATN